MERNHIVAMILLILLGLIDLSAEGAIGGRKIANSPEDVPAETGLVSSCTGKVRYTGVPIPWGTNSFSSASFRQVLENFYRQLAFSAYAKGSFHSEQWDASVSNLISVYAAQAAGEHKNDHFSNIQPKVSNDKDRQSLMPSLKHIDDIMAKGCADPFVGYMRTVLATQLGRQSEDEMRLREIYLKLQKEGYASIYQFMVMRQLIKSGANRTPPSELKSLKRTMMQELGAAASDPMFRSNGFQRCYLELLPTSLTNETFAPCLHELETNKGVDPWIKAMVKGKRHIDLAWQSRGDGWANTVTKEGWDGFFDELKLARQELRTAQSLHPEFPEAAANMITVSLGGGDEDSTRQWFDRAVKAQFDYLPAYDGYKMSLYPRWCGSHEQMFSFALECLNIPRTDTSVPIQFIIILDKILNELPDIRPFCQQPGVFEAMERCYTNVLPKYYIDMSIMRSRMVMMAWAAGRTEDALKYYRESNGRFRAEAVDWLNIDPASIEGEIHMPAGPQKDRYREADRLVSARDYQRASAILQELHDSGFAKGTPAASLISTRLAISHMGAGLATGEWTTLISKDDIASWMGRGGKWSYDPRGTGVLKASPIAHEMMVVCRVPMPENYEIEGDIQAGCRAGLALGIMRTIDREECASILLNTVSNQVVVGTSFVAFYKSALTAHDITPPLKNQNHFLIRVKGGKITVTINDCTLFTYDGSDREWWASSGGLIGLGGIASGTTNDVVYYENLRIRNLMGEPSKK